jgi:hypothetical protein
LPARTIQNNHHENIPDTFNSGSSGFFFLQGESCRDQSARRAQGNDHHQGSSQDCRENAETATKTGADGYVTEKKETTDSK